MNLTQSQIQTQTKPTAEEILTEITQTYLDNQGWVDVLDILPVLWVTPSVVIGDKLCNLLKDGITVRALAERRCPEDGEELKPVTVSGHPGFRCPKCYETWPKVELNES